MRTYVRSPRYGCHAAICCLIVAGWLPAAHGQSHRGEKLPPEFEGREALSRCIEQGDLDIFVGEVQLRISPTLEPILDSRYRVHTLCWWRSAGVKLSGREVLFASRSMVKPSPAIRALLPHVVSIEMVTRPAGDSPRVPEFSAATFSVLTDAGPPALSEAGFSVRGRNITLPSDMLSRNFGIPLQVRCGFPLESVSRRYLGRSCSTGFSVNPSRGATMGVSYNFYDGFFPEPEWPALHERVLTFLSTIVVDTELKTTLAPK